MKTCLYCKEEIKDDAIKCRYCSSSLLPGGPPAPATSQADSSSPQVTYVLDRDLVRFAKFSGAVLAIFAIVGAFLYGFDVKQAAKEIKDVQAEAVKTRDEIEKARETATRIRTESAQLLKQAEDDVRFFSQKRTEVIGIVGEITASATHSGQTTSEQYLVKYLDGALTPQQMAVLRKNIAAGGMRHEYSKAEVLALIQADIGRALVYYRSHGLQPPPVTAQIQPTPNYMNAYWDGHQLVFGMGMVNSDQFGPYEAGIVIHEATHSVFDITFQGQSGAVSESICDVVAVVIRGGDWTIGSVRTPNPSVFQALRSLKAPGTAYDTPILGKDAQVADMAHFSRDPQDNGGIRINNGILNHAAYLMSEGGQAGSVTVANGIGREKLGSLYMEVIKRLPKGSAVDFIAFRDLVVGRAREVLTPIQVETVRSSFKAVGL